MIHISSDPAEQGSGRVAQKRAVRTDVILDRATALVAEDGLDKLTLQRVGAAMGVVPAALYRYFPSKDALVAALQRRAVAATHAAFTASQAAAEPALRKLAPEVAAVARLVTTARFYLDLPRTHPEAWLLVAILLGDPRHLLSEEESRETAPMLAAFLMDVHAQIEHAAKAGALSRGDATLRTMVWWAALQGALALGKARRIAAELPSPIEVGMEATRALTLGWGVAPETWKRAARAAEGAAARPTRDAAAPAKAGTAKTGTAKRDEERSGR